MHSTYPAGVPHDVGPKRHNHGWRPSLRGVLAAAVMLALQSGTALATPPCIAGSAEYATMRSFYAEALPAAANQDRIPVLLTTPQGWREGCAVAMLPWDGRDPLSLRNRLLVALLEHGIAVAEVDIATPHGFSADSDRAPATPSPEVLAADLLGALQQLRQEEQPGHVVVLGTGLGGEAALAAARLGMVENAGFSAATQLDLGGSYISANASRNVAGWPELASRVCRVLSTTTRMATACMDRWTGDGHGIEVVR